jgi:tetratricopeptide (TPR) repeat protein
MDALKQAVARHRAGDLAGATAQYEAILGVDPENAGARHLLGVVALQRQEYERAVALIGEAIRQKGDAAPFYHNRAAALRALGRFAEAEADYREALRLSPEYAEAYFNYSAVKKFTREDGLHEAIEKQLTREGVSRDDRCFLHFAAGKIYDDLQRYDDAFAHYAEGNRQRQAKFDREAQAAQYAATIERFSPTLLAAKAEVGFRSDVPVFVVGMPRSGTTLVEQIIASHEQAHGAGELNDISAIVRELPKHAGGKSYPGCVASLGDNVLRGFGEAYVERIRSLAPTAERIVDKMPRNFEHLGLIRLLLPEARVILCRRDPRDTLLSCYFQRFRTGQEWSYDLGDLVVYYRQYLRLMEHWRAALPVAIFDVDYESLVADPAATSRAIVEFCGLPWSDACEVFHLSPRPVATASNWQVRQPVYPSSVGRWKRYEWHLGPLLAEAEKLSDRSGTSC